MREWVRMLEAGTASQELCFSNATSVVYAKDDQDKVVGAILFSVDDTKRQGWIYLAMVDADRRKQHLYQDMYALVEQECKRRGAVTLSSNVHVSNTPMLNALKKNGREAQWLKTTKAL